MATDTNLQAAFRRLFRVHLWLAPQFRSAAAQDFTGGSRSRHTQARSWDDEERGGAGGHFTPELTSLVAAQLVRVRVLSRKLNRIVPHLFPHLSGRRQAQRITEFNKPWHTACVRAGLGMFLNVSGPQKKYRRYRGPLVHDFRRTAVRNTVNPGAPDSAANTA